MNWLIIVFCSIPVGIIGAVIMANAKRTNWFITGMCIMSIFIGIAFGIGMPLSICRQNIWDKHDWYIETRLKYAEADGIEKEYLEMTDVMEYNLWYEKNKEDLEDPWNFKSAAGCEFDYIKVGD
jgi:hypothetical protein